MRSFHSIQFCGRMRVAYETYINFKMTNLWLFVVALAIAPVYGQMSTGKITMKKVDVKMNPNPYFDTFTASLSSGGEVVSLKTPVKKDLPPTMMAKISVIFSGIELPETDMPLCDAFSDPFMGMDILSTGIPKGKFPKNCPVGAGKDFGIDKYKFPSEKVPPGTPPGPVSGSLSIYEPGSDPYVIISLEAQLDLNMPDVGIPGMKPPGFG